VCVCVCGVCGVCGVVCVCCVCCGVCGVCLWCVCVACVWCVICVCVGCVVCVCVVCVWCVVCVCVCVCVCVVCVCVWSVWCVYKFSVAVTVNCQRPTIHSLTVARPGSLPRCQLGHVPSIGLSVNGGKASSVWAVPPLGQWSWVVHENDQSKPWGASQ